MNRRASMISMLVLFIASPQGCDGELEGIAYALAAVAIGSVIAWLIGRWLTRRLYAVQETTNRSLASVSNAVAVGIERKRMEQEVARLASFPMLSPQPILEVDLEGNVIFANPAMLRLYPDQKEVGTDPWLRDWDSLVAPCRDKGESPPDREVAVADRWYHQTMYYVPEERVLRVYGIDITERKRAERALQESEHKYREVFDNVLDGLFLLEVTEDSRFRNVEINPALERSVGIARALLIGKTLEESVPNGAASVINAACRRSVEAGHPIEQELALDVGSARRFYQATLIPLHDDTGRTNRIIGISRDVTDKKHADDALRRLNRELRAISACNQTLLRAEDEQSLLDEVCRIICDEAGYRAAWVGYAEHDASKNVRPAAWAGKEGEDVAHPMMTWADDTALGRGPVGEAIRSGKAVYVQDFATDPRVAPWRESGLQRGYRSAIASPLKDEDGVAFGVLTIYGSESDAITPDEIRLVEELSGDLAFGITGLRMRAQRRRAVDALQEERRLFIGGPNVAFKWKAAEGWPVEYVSPNLEDQFGYLPEDFTSGRVPYASVVHPDDLVRVAEEVMENSREGVPFFEQEYRIARADGEYRWIYDFTVVVRDSDGVITHYHGHIADITERRRAERNVVLMSFALDNIREAAFLIDESARFQFVNEESCRALGYSREELLGMGVADVDPDKPTEDWADHWNELKTRRSLTFEGRHRAKDGHLFPVEIGANYFEYDGRGYNLALVRDITERKRAEEVLRRLNRELRAISSCNQALLHAEDEQILLHDVCRIVCEEAGYCMAWVGYGERDGAETVRPAAWAGVEGTDFVGSAITWTETEGGRSPVGVAMRTGKSACVQDFAAASEGPCRESALKRGYRSCIALPLKAPTGSTFGVFSVFSREPNAVTEDEVRLLEELSGDLAYGIVALRTRVEREKAEAKLRKVSMAVEQSPVSVVITDTAGRIEYVNPWFTAVTGYAMTEVLGQNPRILKSGRTSPEEYQRLWQTITSGRVWRGEFENRKKNGESFWEQASISPIFDASGSVTHFVAVKEDTTQRRRLEEEFRQAQKLEAVGQLAGGVAHDFNNILAVIMMKVGLMMSDERLSADVRSGLEELELAANRAASLTRQLLLFSRRQVLDAKPLDLSEVVSNMTKMLRRLIGEDIDLIFQGPASGLWVTADAGMMDQVLMNLCVNARDAMPHGGQLTVGARRVEIDAQSAAVIPGAREGSFICLSVTDNGCGMDEKTLEHIFEPFFTTKEVGRGTGLGLATVYGIVNQHRGWVQVETAPGKGAAFHIYLPAFLDVAEARTVLAKLDVRGGTEGILVVEDDATLRTLAASGLRKAGYIVWEAADGHEALKLWERYQRAIDVLLTDMVMPGRLSGLELAERLILDKAQLGVIITSGYTTDKSSSEALRAKGIVYLSKPYNVAGLAGTVRASLDLVAIRS